MRSVFFLVAINSFFSRTTSFSFKDEPLIGEVQGSFAFIFCHDFSFDARTGLSSGFSGKDAKEKISIVFSATFKSLSMAFILPKNSPRDVPIPAVSAATLALKVEVSTERRPAKVQGYVSTALDFQP